MIHPVSKIFGCGLKNAGGWAVPGCGTVATKPELGAIQTPPTGSGDAFCKNRASGVAPPYTFQETAFGGGLTACTCKVLPAGTSSAVVSLGPPSCPLAFFQETSMKYFAGASAPATRLSTGWTACGIGSATVPTPI